MAAWSDKAPVINISGVLSVFGEEGDITEVNYVKLSTASPDATKGVGSMFWDADAGTVAISLAGGNVTLQLGQEQNFLGLNKTGVTIANGAVVSFDGAQADRAKIILADADSATGIERLAGIVTESILNNAEGFVTTRGIVHDVDTSAWSVGDYLYVSSTAGTLTNVAPVPPAHAAVVGIVLREHITQGMIYVDIDRGEHLSALHDVLISAPANEQTLTYDAATGLWKNTKGFAGKTDMTGFPVDSSGNYLCTLTYNETARTVTLTPTSASFDVFVGGTKYTLTGAQSIAHSAVGTQQFVYYDETGTLVTSTTAWDLLKHAPVCFILQDVTNSRRIPFEERHHAGRDLYWHRNQHSAEGTKATGSGFQVAGYTFNTPGDANNTFSIASGRLEDEDIRVDTEALPDAGPYAGLYRSGASGEWLLTRNNVVPFFRSGTNIQYNQNTGATWQLTNLANNEYVNYFVFGVTALPQASITPAPGCVQQYVIIPSQQKHASQALASAETVGSISWGSAPFQEIVPLYKATFLYQSGGGGTVELRELVRVIGTSASISAAAQTDHPASAIINTPSGNLAATDVQAALNELQADIDLRATIASLGTMASQNANAVAITGGTVNGTSVGATTPSTGAFTTLTTSGTVAIGSTLNAGQALRVVSTALTGTSQYGLLLSNTGTSAATTSISGILAAANTAAASFTVAELMGINVLDAIKGAGSTISVQYGLKINAQGQGVINYGIHSSVAAAANNWNLYSSGTAKSYHSGAFLIGTTVDDGVSKLQVAGDISITGKIALDASYGTAGQVLTSQGPSADPTWTTVSGGGGSGTMSSQDADAVAITGGTIDGTTVGATTPSSGAFTTLSATGNTTLGNAATDTTSINGYAAIGGSLNAGYGLAVTNTALSGTTQGGLIIDHTGTSGSTTANYGLEITVKTAVASFTSSIVAGIRIQTPVEGAGSTITSYFGARIASSTVGTNNYGVYLEQASGSANWALYSAGSAKSHHLGSFLIGTTTDNGTDKLQVTGSASVTGNVTLGDASTDTVIINGLAAIGGSTNTAHGLRVVSAALASTSQLGIVAAPTGTSAATASVVAVYAQPGTAAASFTTSAAVAYQAADAVKGSGSTITDQYGFRCNALTQGAGNYAFWSAVAAGATNWNVYAIGTAKNYFNGTVLIGTTTDDGTAKLQVNGGVALSTAANNHYIREGTGWIWTSTGTIGGTVRGGIYAQSGGTLSIFAGASIVGTHLTISVAGNSLIGSTSDDGVNKLQVTGTIKQSGDVLGIATAKTPASASATGVTGSICWDANYIYVCTATNTWKRSAIATW